MEEISLYEKIVSSEIGFIIMDLNRYGGIWSVEDICQCIEQKNIELKKLLISLNTYGMYDFLLAICQIVNIYCCENIQIWFYNQLNCCPDREMIIELANGLYEKKMLEAAEVKAMWSEFGDDWEYIPPISMIEIQNYIWGNYKSEFLRKISRSNPKNVGVYFPMIQKNLKYMKKLEDNVFPYLIMTAKDIREMDNEDNAKECFVRMRIVDYLIELGIFYYYKIEYVLDELIKIDSKEVAQLDHNEYIQMIQNILEKKLGYRLYITNTITDYLSEMIHISEYFGDNLDTEGPREMKVYLPLLYQLTGREREAYSLLIDTIQYLPKTYAIRKVYLLTFYRQLLIIKDEKQRQRLIGIFDEIYFSNSGLREFITVAKHISIFFQKYSNRIKENKLVLKLLEFCEIPFSEKEIILQWFRDGVISDKFNSLLDIMMNKSGFIRSKAINEFIELFYSLSSHREDSMCIIMPKQCAKILGIKNYSQIVRGDEELAYFYTKEETREICTLAKQMEKAQCQMPAYGWQQYYIGIKQKIEYFWNRDEDSILCSKLLIAFRGIQSDPYNKWEFDRNGNIVRKRDEDSINNLVAFFLKAYYGEENIHREEPQGLSENGDKCGEIDILIYHNGTQFAIQEAVKIEFLEKIKINNHLNRLINNYDTQGVPVTCLAIYAYAKQRQMFFEKMENYLKNYLNADSLKYEIVSKLQREDTITGNICHHSVTYHREGMIQKLHIFTVLM